MSIPRLHKSADRCYSLVEPFNVGAFRAYIESIGGHYQKPQAGDCLHRWVLDTAAGRTTVSYYPSGRIVCLGPAIVALDELVECSVSVEPMPGGGAFLAFEGGVE
jgi:hypothetical protein